MFIVDDKTQSIRNVLSCQVLQLQHVEIVCLAVVHTIWTVLWV